MREGRSWLNVFDENVRNAILKRDDDKKPPQDPPAAQGGASVAETTDETRTTEEEQPIQKAQEETPTKEEKKVNEPTAPNQDSDAPVEQANTEEQNNTEEQISDLRPPMPMKPVEGDKQGRMTEDWLATTPEQGYDYLTIDMEFDAEETSGYIDAQLQKAEKTLKAESKKKANTSAALNAAEFKQAKEAQKAHLASLQAEVDYWKAMKKLHNAKRNEEAKKLDAQLYEKAVAQAEEDKRTKAEKEAEQAEVGANAVNPKLKAKWNEAHKEHGKTDEIVLPNGEVVKGHYVLVESGTPTPSHQSDNGFTETEGFPVDENGQSVNDRDYKRDKEAQQVTLQMADNYDQRAVQTPVVVSKDGVVLSGNGRTMAGEIAARQGTDTKYNDYLRANADKYGFTEEQVAQYEHPRVVFEADAEMPYDAKTFAKFNQREQKSQSKTEQAVKMGKVVDDNLFGRVMDTVGQFDTLADFYADDKATYAVIKALADSGIIPQTEMAALFDGGKLSEQGQALVENILIGKVFEGNPDAVREITEVKSVRKAVMNALQSIVTNNRLGGGYALSDELSQAIDLVYKARQAGYKVGDRVSEFARQGNLFEEDGATVADYRNATIMMLADVLNDSRVTQLKKVVEAYNERAEVPAQGIEDMFVGKVSKEQIINEIRKAFNYGQSEQDQSTAPLADGQGSRSSGSEQGIPIGTSHSEDERGESGRVEETQGDRGLQEQRNEGVREIYVGLSDKETENLLSHMEANATEVPQLELNPANWVIQFGEDGTVSTPIGRVKMGANQIAKLFEKGRSDQFGMIKPTLEAPQVVIEVPSESNDGSTERNSSLLFVKTFIGKDGKKIYYFKSVTVKKDGLEVSISSHYDRVKRVKEVLKKGKLLYRFDGGAQTEHHPADVSVTTSHGKRQGVSSVDKGTNNPNTAQASEEKNIHTDEQGRSTGTSKSASEKKSASEAKQKGTSSKRDFSVREEEDVNYSDVLSKDSGLHFGKGNGKSVVNPKDFLPTKKQVKEDRFATRINGIHYWDGFAFVANLTRVIAIRCDYPAEYEGKTINDGTIVEGEYPNVNNIIPVGGNMFNDTASIVSEISQLPKSIEYVVLNSLVFNRSNISPLIDLARKTKNAQLFLDKGGNLCLIGDGVLGICINTEDATDSIIDGFKPNTYDIDRQRVYLSGDGTGISTKEYFESRSKANQETSDEKIRYQRSGLNEIESTAKEYGVDATLLSNYAEAMSENNSAAAMNALHDMKAQYLREHRAEKKALREGIGSLLANNRLFAPVLKAVKEKFGDVDTLIQERIKQAEEEHNMMEAARKRTEEEAKHREAHLEELAQLSDEEIDERYANALANGNEAEAREMLDEVARRKEYGDTESEYQGIGAWAAPSNPGYESDEARRNAVGEDSPELNVEDMAAGYSNQPEDIFEHPNKYSQGLPTSVESGKAIQKAIDAIRSGKKDVRIKVYRAVPTSVKEGKLRNGDWVTPSRRYAEMHGENRLEGKYRIIEDEVSANELWWDSNDVNEWGYDNGNDYRYKNAKNNRKLGDLITRDNNGNIIPPSKRFNSRKADERYQKTNGAVRVSERESAARDALTDLARKALGDDSVVTDGDFGQRVLDDENGRARKMSFGEPYDFEKYPRGRVEPNLAEKSVSVVKANANHGFSNYKEAKSWAKQHVSKIYNNEETGGKGTVRISNAAIDKFMSQSAVDKSESKDVHMAVLKVLPDVLKASIDVETHPDFLKGENGKRNAENGINKDVLVHRCYGGVIIDGKPCRVKITLKENVTNKNLPHNTHSYEATKIELLEGNMVKPEDDNPNTNNSITAANLLNGVEMSYNSGKNLLEESKKRSEKLREQRVFHGSGADFDHFDHSHMGEGEGRQAFGWGTYVTEVKSIGKAYASVKDGPTKQSIVARKDFIKRRKKDIRDMGDYEKYASRIEKTRKANVREYNAAKKAGDESDMKFYADLIAINDEQLKPENHRKTIESFEADIAKAEKEIAEFEHSMEGKHNLYTVEIPDDNGHNYLDWNNLLSEEQKETFRKYLTEKYGEKFFEDFKGYNVSYREGETVYNTLTKLLGSQEEASKALSEMGFVGIKYPADYRRGGREDGAKNYVIFNENDAKITDHVRFFRTPNGEAYGFTIGGKIYIDPRVATAETPIHEYAHIWATAMKKNNPEEWQNIIGLMKGTSVWDEVKKNYPELTDESDIADEVLAHYSGHKGAERLRDEMRKATEGKGSPIEKAEAVSALQRIKTALDKFWKGVADFLHIHYTSAEEVADRVMKDLLDGVDPRKFGIESKVREQFIGERGASSADHAEEVSTRMDNLEVARSMEKAEKDAKAIKMATGWERGADGKWRYEIPDGKYFSKGDAEYDKVRAKQSWSKELDLLEDRIFDGEQLTDEESKRFEELADEEANFKAEYLTQEKPHLAK